VLCCGFRVLGWGILHYVCSFWRKRKLCLLIRSYGRDWRPFGSLCRDTCGGKTSALCAPCLCFYPLLLFSEEFLSQKKETSACSAQTSRIRTSLQHNHQDRAQETFSNCFPKSSKPSTLGQSEYPLLIYHPSCVVILLLELLTNCLCLISIKTELFWTLGNCFHFFVRMIP
jgi:hypothetical protein